MATTDYIKRDIPTSYANLIKAFDECNRAVTADKLAEGAVTAAKLASNAVEEAKIKNAAVATDKIADNAVTFAKIAAAAKSTTTPKTNGTANAGTESAFARGDHVHPTELAAKDLGNVDFNTVISPGYYIVKGAVNAPTTNATAYLVHVYSGNGAIIQDAVYYNATGGTRARWWRKQNNGGSWEAWAQIAVKDEVVSQTDLLKMVNIQSGNLFFGGNWSFSAEGVLTKGNAAADRITTIPVAKTQSTSGFIDWVASGAAWPAITGLGTTPNIAGGYSITIPVWTAIIGRHTRGGNHTAAALYALEYTQTNLTDLLQPGDIILCMRIGTVNNVDKLLLGSGQVIGGGVSIVNGGITDSNKANLASPVFTGTPKILDANGSQNKIAVVPDASAAAETSLPVGTYIFAIRSGNTVSAINATVGPCYVPAIVRYAVGGGDMPLAGVWKVSGSGTNGEEYLLRRVA